MLATFECPECHGKEKITVPENVCLAFHDCSHCGKTIKAGKECCIVCEFTDKKCPVPFAEYGE
ncbi:MAG TPA: GDCCVxC domain-containing (seleno)protein [archaeon]|nr:GDCCVxC domain-containing (seleno)protein [archaeon]